MQFHQVGNPVAECLNAVISSQAIAVNHEGDDDDKRTFRIEAPPHVAAIDEFVVKRGTFLVKCQLEVGAILLAQAQNKLGLSSARPFSHLPETVDLAPIDVLLLGGKTRDGGVLLMPAGLAGILEGYRVEVELEVAARALSERLGTAAEVAVARYVDAINGAKYF